MRHSWIEVMSTSANARTAGHNDRRTSATQATQPRVSSTRAETKGRSNFLEDVSPRDSISNAGNSRPTSGSFRTHASTVHTVNERVTERRQITSNESVQVNSKSPLGALAGNTQKAGAPLPSRGPKLGNPSYKREKPAPCRFHIYLCQIRM